MEQTRYAFFVDRPRIIEDLFSPHLLERERPYKVVKTIRLSKINYENFITDMLADRQFIEDCARFCKPGEPIKCILVQQRGHEDGILVRPEDDRYVGSAAYFRE